MKEFSELSDYPLFYEEIGPKNKPQRRKTASESKSKAQRPSLNQQQVSLLSNDLQTPLPNEPGRQPDSQ